jgi:glycosyltransferase involved in cell wall biosynthesis
MYGANTVGHNGGGWIASLEELVRGIPDVKLGIAFEHTDTQFRVDRDGVAYYPIRAGRSLKQRARRVFRIEAEEEALIPHCLRVVSDFRPDVIHVFGSEWCFGLLARHTDIPVVIHMQGSLPPYYNARFPAGFGRYDFLQACGGNPKKLFRLWRNDRVFRLRAAREEQILRGCRNYMGRTEWDKAVVQLYRPDARYFYCSEALRPEIYSAAGAWRSNPGDTMRLATIISTPWYKGIDMVLKCARLLRENTDLAFEWRVFGVNECRFQERKLGIRTEQVNMRLMGVASAAQVKSELLACDVCVHPSHIDNSPNAVCEAQVLGVPVIATNVGGVASLVRHGETGLLVPANEPHMLASRILELRRNPELGAKLGTQGCMVATGRHAPERIRADLIGTYRSVAGGS